VYYILATDTNIVINLIHRIQNFPFTLLPMLMEVPDKMLFVFLPWAIQEVARDVKQNGGIMFRFARLLTVALLVRVRDCFTNTPTAALHCPTDKG
jgi:hypothetical protein